MYIILQKNLFFAEKSKKTGNGCCFFYFFVEVSAVLK
jgi:hypothetical protein